MRILRKAVNLRETIELSRNLGKKILEEFDPDYIVCVIQNGILPGYEVAKELNVPLCYIKIEKDYDIPCSACEEKTTVFEKESDKEMENKKILIINDTVRTGRTMNIAKYYLSRHKPAELKTASLNYTKKTIPDFFMAKERIKFPWETSHKEHKAYLSYLHDIASNELNELKVIKKENSCSCLDILFETYLNRFS